MMRIDRRFVVSTEVIAMVNRDGEATERTRTRLLLRWRPDRRFCRVLLKRTRYTVPGAPPESAWYKTTVFLTLPRIHVLYVYFPPSIINGTEKLASRLGSKNRNIQTKRNTISSASIYHKEKTETKQTIAFLPKLFRRSTQ